MIVAALVSLLAPALSAAEDGEPIRPETLASKMQLFAFPAAGQSAEQEIADEIDCFDWAFGIVGADPFRLEKEVEKRRKSLPPGLPRNQADRPIELGNPIGPGVGHPHQAKGQRIALFVVEQIAGNGKPREIELELHLRAWIEAHDADASGRRVAILVRHRHPDATGCGQANVDFGQPAGGDGHRVAGGRGKAA